MALKNVILFAGTQRALSSAELARWAGAFAEKHGEHNISRFSRSETAGLPTLAGEIASPAFGFAARLVVVEGLLGKRPEWLSAAEDAGVETARAQALAAVKSCPESNFVVFRDEVPEKSDLADWLEANATVKKFDTPTVEQSAKWVAERLPGADDAAARALLRLRNHDLEAAGKDAFRLSLYKPEGTVTEKDVREHCSAPAELDEWGLSNALEALDGKRALAELALQARDRDPIMILASCVGMLRRTVWALRMLAAGKGAGEVAKACAVTDKKLEMVRRRIQYAPRLEALYARLADLDWRAKTGRVPGGAGPGALACFEKILADLISPA